MTMTRRAMLRLLPALPLLPAALRKLPEATKEVETLAPMIGTSANTAIRAWGYPIGQGVTHHVKETYRLAERGGQRAWELARPLEPEKGGEQWSAGTPSTGCSC